MAVGSTAASVFGHPIACANPKSVSNWITEEFCSSRNVIGCVDKEICNAALSLQRGESLWKQGESNDESSVWLPICQMKCDVACDLRRMRGRQSLLDGPRWETNLTGTFSGKLSENFIYFQSYRESAGAFHQLNLSIQ